MNREQLEAITRGILEREGYTPQQIDDHIEKVRAEQDKKDIQNRAIPETIVPTGRVNVGVPEVDPEVLYANREEMLSRPIPGRQIGGKDKEAQPGLTQDQKLKLQVLRQMSESGQLKGLKYDPRTK